MTLNQKGWLRGAYPRGQETSWSCSFRNRTKPLLLQVTSLKASSKSVT